MTTIVESQIESNAVEVGKDIVRLDDCAGESDGPRATREASLEECERAAAAIQSPHGTV
jgi:hypothetical protein